MLATLDRSGPDTEPLPATIWQLEHFPVPKKYCSPAARSPGTAALGRRNVHRVDPGGERFEFTGREIKRGHASRGNSILDHLLQPCSGFPVQVANPRQCRSVFAAARLGTMAKRTFDCISSLCLRFRRCIGSGYLRRQLNARGCNPKDKKKRELFHSPIQRHLLQYPTL